MGKSTLSYRRTLAACFIGYLVQAAICTFAPLLYVRFRTEFGFSLDRISAIIAVTFIVQLFVDLASSVFVERIGHRVCLVAAHFLAAAGFVLMGVLPDVTADPFTGLMIAVVMYSVGAGLIEVLISPTVEACPTKRKNATMNLLHSCFAWGEVLVVLGSTLFFTLCGIDNWRLLCCLWAIIPAANGALFLFVPLNVFGDGASTHKQMKKLLASGKFWLLLVIMICAGAAELAVSQWASALVETGLHLDKTVGDLLGVCMFGAFMGFGRLFGTRFEDRSLHTVMLVCTVLCAVSYLMIGLVPIPAINLIGMALCGFAVSLLWPMTLSLAAHTMPEGGMALFGLLAFGGDIGCALGPWWAGTMAARFGDDLQIGILFSLVFPAILLAALFFVKRKQTDRR